jgi:tRNA (mo5U34)-methyltransferase
MPPSISPESVREARLRQDHSEELAEKGWYHSFELPDGTLIEGVNPLPRLRERFAHFPIPGGLSGKRLLDIGAWDGWFSFEAERHGAQVTAVDCWEAPHFVELHRKFSSKVDYRILDIYELPFAGLGQFDVVFFLGVLYHLRHPLLALEIVCSLTTDIAIVESFVTDGDTWREHTADIPTMEFYEGRELANQFDNWVGPSVACLLAMCRAAGFARVELLRSEPYNGLVACYRKWEPPPAAPTSAPPHSLAVANNADQGINFASRKEQYITCWFRSPRAEIMNEDLRLEVGAFGVACYWTGNLQDHLWAANFPLPRGLAPGWHAVRLRFADSDFSDAVRIAVDLPINVSRIVWRGVRDSITWQSDEVSVTAEGHMACWVAGLPENADRHNVRIYLGDTRLSVQWLGTPDAEAVFQVNALVPGTLPKGTHMLRIECGGVSSDPHAVRLV